MMTDTATILYVDDEPANVVLFKANFYNDYNVLTANSGVEALEILHSNNEISAVISDFRMPNMSGIELIRKAHKDFPNLNYYILTGFDSNDEIEAILEENILDSYFNKPLDISKIKETLNRAMVS